MRVYPKISASLCARMSRGFNGQDAVGLCPVVEVKHVFINRQWAIAPDCDEPNVQYTGLHARQASRIRGGVEG